jgi:hypothetical protein
MTDEQRPSISKNNPFVRPKPESAKKIFGKFFARGGFGFAGFTPRSSGW